MPRKWKGENDTQSYERQPRANKDEAAGGRELLPVKADNGTWKARHAKKEGGKGKKGRGAAGDGKEADASSAVAPVAEPTFGEKRAAIAKLSSSLLNSPQKNVGLLQDLHKYATRDASPAAQRLAALSLVAVLRDILPSYRIRLPTEKELTVKVSADVEGLRAYEKALLTSYEVRFLTQSPERTKLLAYESMV